MFKCEICEMEEVDYVAHCGACKLDFMKTSEIEQLRAKLEKANERIETMLSAMKSLRVITIDEVENGTPYWVVPCHTYEPIKNILSEELEKEPV